MEPVKPSFSNLPHELILQIFSYLGPKELLLATSVCSLFNRLCRDDILWKVHFLRDRPFERFESGGYLQAYGAAGQSRINAHHSRYTVEDITFDRENALPGSRWLAFTVYRDRIYAATNLQTLEIWDLNSREKARNDIPLQGVKPYEIAVSSRYVNIHSENGVDDYTRDEEEASFEEDMDEVCKHKCFVTDAVTLEGYTRKSRMVVHGHATGSQVIDAISMIRSFFTRGNTVYALTTMYVVERWDLPDLVKRESVDVKRDGKIPSRIIGVGKNGEIVMEYFSSTEYITIISWNPDDGMIIKEIKIKGRNVRFLESKELFYQGIRLFSSGDLLFCVFEKGIVEVRELHTLEIKSRLMATDIDSALFPCIHCDGQKLYVPKKWDSQTKSHTLEMFDFLPAEEALENKDQIALRQRQEKMSARAVRYQEIENLMDDDYDTWGDCCSGIFVGLWLCCLAGATDLLEYLWDGFCDFTEWVSSFFGEGEAVQEIIPPLLVPLPHDRPPDNGGPQ